MVLIQFLCFIKEQRHLGRKMKVLFSTNCYYRDFSYLFKGGFEYKYLLNAYPFAARWMIVNNMPNPNAAQKAFGTMSDEVLIAEEVADRALHHFGFTPDIFVDPETQVDGWKYSIDSLIELAFGKHFDYICHYCGDVSLYKKGDWITPGIKKIEEGYAGARPKLPRYEMQVEGEQEKTETNEFSNHEYLIH